MAFASRTKPLERSDRERHSEPGPAPLVDSLRGCWVLGDRAEAVATEVSNMIREARSEREQTGSRPDLRDDDSVVLVPKT